MLRKFLATDLARLIQGYRLYAKTVGKSDKTIAIVANSVRYFEDFLRSEGLPTDVTQIGLGEVRAFIRYLQQKKCFSGHPLNKTQERGLSGHTINCYLRSVRAFWSWLVLEEIIEANPVARLKIPRPPKKLSPPSPTGNSINSLTALTPPPLRAKSWPAPSYCSTC